MKTANTAVKEDSFNKNNFEFLFEMERRHFWFIGRKQICLSLINSINNHSNSIPKLMREIL
jgi:hypothetical protein